MPALTVLPVGATAHLVEVADATTALDVAAHLRHARVAATDVVPGAETVLVDGVDRAALDAALATWQPGAKPPTGALVEVPVVYDGADIDDVADRWGTDRDGVAQRLATTDLVSAFCGFAPGFAYLAGLPDELAVPRLDSPRSRVPAGSVALAGSWCGVYPTASPGGWRLLGRTDVVLWDADRADPALLAPGTRVRFVPA